MIKARGNNPMLQPKLHIDQYVQDECFLLLTWVGLLSLILIIWQKISPVVKVAYKPIKNWSRYLGYRLIHIYRLLHSYRLLCSYSLLQSYRLLHSYRLQRLSVEMNGFNSKVTCKNSSVTIWDILFNIAIPIIHHKLYSKGGFVKYYLPHTTNIIYVRGVESSSK